MNRTQEPHPLHGQPAFDWRTWSWSAVLVFLVTVVYLPTLDNDFFCDDRINITDNVAMRSLQGLSDIWFKLGTVDQYYPLSYSALWSEYQFFGPNPRGYHVINWLLHAVSAVLVWRVLSRLMVPGAWLAAAIFAMHPVEVESVAWVIELRNLLSCVLALGSLLAYFRFSPPEPLAASDPRETAGQGRWVYYFLAFGLYTASLLAKTATAALPAVLLVIYWWKRGRLTWRDVVQTVPLFAVGLALCGVTVWVEHTYWSDNIPEWDYTVAERVLLAGRALCFYVGKLIWPYPLIWVYPRWIIDDHQAWQFVYPAAVVSAIVVLWLARKRIGRGPLAAVLIFAGVLLPILGFVDMFCFTFVHDHWQYHASIALIALAAAAATLAARMTRRAPWLGPLASASLLLALAVVAHRQTYIWKDEISVVTGTIERNPECSLAHFYLGALLYQQGQNDQASLHVRRAIALREQSIQDDPTSVSPSELAATYTLYGLVALHLGRSADAECGFHAAIATRETLANEHPTMGSYPNALAASYRDLATAQRQAGRTSDAATSTARAIEIREKLIRDHPDAADYQASLAASYEELAVWQQANGRLLDAVASRRRAIEIREHLAHDDGLLTVTSRMNYLTEVRQKLAQDKATARQYQDDFAASYADLGNLQRNLKKPIAAEEAFRCAIELRDKLAAENPAINQYQNRRGAAYADLGLLQRDLGLVAESEESFRKAIEIRERVVREEPTVAEYQVSLAATYDDLSILLQTGGRTAEAAASRNKAIAVRERLARNNPAIGSYRNQLAGSYVDVGTFHRDNGQWGEAVSAFRKAVEIREQLVHDQPSIREFHDALAWSHVHLALAQQQAGQPADAVVSYHQALAIRQRLLSDEPTNPVNRANLASIWTLCGDALALLGSWKESADSYALAVSAGDASWRTMAHLAWLQLAAGNDIGYRATCVELVRRHGDSTEADALLAIALTIVTGDKALDDDERTLALARRAAHANPMHPLAAIVVGVAEYRAGRRHDAITSLARELLELAPGTSQLSDKPDQILFGRLLGGLILALAYHEEADRALLENQLAALRTWIDQASAIAAPTIPSGLPPWSARFAVEIVNRALGKIKTPINRPVGASCQEFELGRIVLRWKPAAAIDKECGISSVLSEMCSFLQRQNAMDQEAALTGP